MARHRYDTNRHPFEGRAPTGFEWASMRRDTPIERCPSLKMYTTLEMGTSLERGTPLGVAGVAPKHGYRGDPAIMKNKSDRRHFDCTSGGEWGRGGGV